MAFSILVEWILERDHSMDELMLFISTCRSSREQVASHTRLTLGLLDEDSYPIFKILVGVIRHPYAVYIDGYMLDCMSRMDTVCVLNIYDCDTVFSVEEIIWIFPNVRDLTMYLGVNGALQIPPGIVLPNLEVLRSNLEVLSIGGSIDFTVVAPNLTEVCLKEIYCANPEVILPDDMKMLSFTGTPVIRGKHIDQVIFDWFTKQTASLEIKSIDVLCLFEGAKGTVRGGVIGKLIPRCGRSISHVEFVDSVVESVFLISDQVQRISLDTNICSIKRGHVILPLNFVDDLVLVKSHVPSGGTALFIRNPTSIQCDFSVKRLHVCRCTQASVQVKAQETIFYECDSCVC